MLHMLTMQRCSARVIALAVGIALGSPVWVKGEVPVQSGTPGANQPAADWLTGNGVSLGGILFPHLHFQSVYGGTSANELPEVGHHDPLMDGWTVQGFEFGLSGRFNDHLQAYGTYHLYYDRESEEWGDHFEEWFGKIRNLPGGFEIRGGRYLNRFGFHNQMHLHGWDFVDENLVSGRFMGDDGLYSLGGEVSWTLPVSWTSVLSVSVGVPPEDPEQHEHAAGAEPLFESDGALFDDVFMVANWTNNFDYDDFHQYRALSGAWGGNRWGRNTQIYGAHVEFQWRENGYESGGRYLRWRTEAILRSMGAVSGHLPGESQITTLWRNQRMRRPRGAGRSMSLACIPR